MCLEIVPTVHDILGGNVYYKGQLDDFVKIHQSEIFANTCRFSVTKPRFADQ